MAASTASTSLTETDRLLVGRAVELAALSGEEAYRERSGQEDITLAYAWVLGEAKHLLDELAAIIERLAAAE